MTEQYTFVIDFVGLLNSRRTSVAELARRAGMTRARVQALCMGDPTRYSRTKIGRLLVGLGVPAYPPLFIEDTEQGPRLSVDWTGLMAARGVTIRDLVKLTRLSYHRLYGMISRNPDSYDRIILGTSLSALGVQLYPPFFLINTETGEPRGPHGYTPADPGDYYRAKPKS